jgi:hypothetical protein
MDREQPTNRDGESSNAESTTEGSKGQRSKTAFRDLFRKWQSAISLAVGVFGVLLTLFVAYGLQARLTVLETANRKNTFALDAPTMEIIIPADINTRIAGPYAAPLPYGMHARAVLVSETESYFRVSQDQPFLDTTRGRWSMQLHVPAGKWTVHMCLADDKGAMAMDDWLYQTMHPSSPTADMAKKELPDGVFMNSTFEFKAVKQSTPVK